MALQTKTFSYGSLAYQSESNAYVLELIVTEESVDQIANTSQISYKLQLRSGPNNRFSAYIDCAVTLAGQTQSLTGMGIGAAYNHTYTLLTGTVTVPHREDGTLDMVLRASIDTPQTNPYAPPDITISDTMTLTAIPRASSVAATSAYIGDTVTVAVGRKSMHYSHSLAYSFGALSGYLADAAGTLSDEEVKLTDTTVLFPLPVTFYGQIPDAPAAPCTLTCTTYYADGVIGQTQTVFTVTADPARCSPVLTGTAADVNEEVLTLTGSPQILVLGKSTVQCAVQAQAQQGAEITAVYVNGVQMANNPCTIDKFSAQGVVLRAVDSRGYETEFVVPGLSFVPYVPLSFYAGATRTDPTGAEACLSVSGKWYSRSFGERDNILTMQYQIDGGQWIIGAVVTDGDDLRATITLTGLDYRSGHTIGVRLFDALETLEKTVSVPKGIPVFDWGENDFAFHVPVRFTATDGTVFTLDLTDGQLTAIV